MFPLTCLDIAPATMLAFLQYIDSSDGAFDTADAADEAVRQWLERRRREAAPPGKPAVNGYQWKCLYLPEGTRLKVRNCPAHGHAEVVGDQILHKGRPVSPNQFLLGCTGTVRNAWVEIDVLMPGDKRWISARARRWAMFSAARAPGPAPRKVEPPALPSASGTSPSGTPPQPGIPSQPDASQRHVPYLDEVRPWDWRYLPPTERVFEPYIPAKPAKSTLGASAQAPASECPREQEVSFGPAAMEPAQAREGGAPGAGDIGAADNEGADDDLGSIRGHADFWRPPPVEGNDRLDIEYRYPDPTGRRSVLDRRRFDAPPDRREFF